MMLLISLCSHRNEIKQEIVDAKRNFRLHPIFRDVTGPWHHVRIGLNEGIGVGFAGCRQLWKSGVVTEQGDNGGGRGTGYSSTSLVIGLGERFELRPLSDFHSI